MVVSKRKTTLRSLTARLLVLGDKQVGKSASIVRYTTGRFIEEYSQVTNDWLYRHSAGFNEKQNVTTLVELLEQNDIHFSNSSNFFASSTSLNSNNIQSSNNNININKMINRMNNCNSVKSSNNYTSSNQQSLASRVALDQQIDNEMHEKQQMLNKLHWANAYIVIYAINDISTFNKAIKYLNLIANNINSPLDNHQISSNNSGSPHNSTSGNSSGCCSNISPNSSNHSTFNHGSANGLFNRLSPMSSHQAATTNKLPINNHSSSNCHCCNSANLAFNTTKRPILLLGNKRDLEKSGARQVSSNDGRMLAMRHQAMFAELSIAESNKLIESTLDSLIDQIDLAAKHVDNLSPKRQQQLLLDLETQPKLVQWCPTIELIFSQTSNSPVWATLVKSQTIGPSIVKSNRVVSTRQETDVRLIKPIGSVAKSVETKSLVKPLVATCRPLKKHSTTSLDSANPAKMKPTSAANKIITTANQKLLNSNRYENFKSSFRRASMAIVGGKTIAKSLAKPVYKLTEKDLGEPRTGNLPQSTKGSSDLESESMFDKNSCKVPSNTTFGPSTWIKSHIRLSRQDNCQKPVISSSSDPKLNTQIAANPVELQATDRFKKQLFKYNSRRKTVAFEQIEGRAGCMSLEGVGKNLQEPLNSPEAKKTCDGRANSSGSCGYNSTRCSSGRSSSSLSNVDVSYSPLFFLCSSEKVTPSSGSASVCSSNRSSVNGQQAKPLNWYNSKSTLSRASTSGDSYEDTSGDEMLTDSNTTINSRVFRKARDQRAESFKQTLSPMVDAGINIDDSHNNAKKRYQLVKSVQSTLTNLTRSSSIAAKRSFCSALLSLS